MRNTINNRIASSPPAPVVFQVNSSSNPGIDFSASAIRFG